MKRKIIIPVAAIAALGAGVAVGSTYQGSDQGSNGVKPASTGPTPDQIWCEQARKKLLAEHPDAYVSVCNHGEGTLPVP